MHLVIAPRVRIEQTRRQLAILRDEGPLNRITPPRARRTRVWFPTPYGVQVACQWPELRGLRPPKTAYDRTAVRLRAGHRLTVTETALAFLQDARRRGELCQPLDCIPKVYHPIGGGEAVIPDALLYHRRGGDGGSMLRAFVEVDRATMGPEHLAAKLPAYARLHAYVPAPPPDSAAGQPSARSPRKKNAPALPVVSPGAVRPGRHRHPPGSPPASMPCTPPPVACRRSPSAARSSPSQRRCRPAPPRALSAAPHRETVPRCRPRWASY
ncbi:replication-relaxation family protein [Streptomyces sp. NPDC057798]|uniref:replication-relaxation family protein n=1 Tax=Streptomyces sp. NPDC057798 TaxID=3346252 RepID=UPI0036AA3809